jgi:putative hydrolase of the HAD superfamily
MIVFDLDDTLYLERDFVRSGFRNVAEVVAVAAGASPADVYRFLWQGFLRGGRGRSFDELMRRWPSIERVHSVGDLVGQYRRHTPGIRPLPEAVATLRDLRSVGAKLAMISDGPLASQSAKLAALGLADWFDEVIFTDQRGPEYWKPHPWAFEEVCSRLAAHPEESVYVGDNPHKDFIAPNRLGWDTVRLRRRGQLHLRVEPAASIAAPAKEVARLSELTTSILQRPGC